MSSSFLPLNAKQDVRPGTRNPGTFDSTLINSSVMPSLKYSSFLSALMFTNGKTAIDFSAMADAGADVFGFPCRQKRKVEMAMRIKIAAPINAHFGITGLGCAADTAAATGSNFFGVCGFPA